MILRSKSIVACLEEVQLDIKIHRVILKTIFLFLHFTVWKWHDHRLIKVEVIIVDVEFDYAVLLKVFVKYIIECSAFGSIEWNELKILIPELQYSEMVKCFKIIVHHVRIRIAQKVQRIADFGEAIFQVEIN